MKVQAVQYPHVITEDGQRILIEKIDKFISAPCTIREVFPESGEYEVVIDKGTKPKEPKCGP